MSGIGLQRLATVVVIFLLGALAGQVCRAEQPPNVVLIYADDVGYGDLGCYGATTIPTPNLDRLAEHGLRFTSGYCTSASCTPSRYSLLTGKYAWRTPGTGIAAPNETAIIKPSTSTLASMFREAGYRTGIVGKWHLGLGEHPKPDWSGEIKPGPLEIGFESSFILPTTSDRVPCVYVRGHRIVGLDPADPVDVYYENPDGQPTGKTHRNQLKMDWLTEGHSSSIVNGISRIGFMTGGNSARWTDETMGEVFAKEARDFVSSDDRRPFFLYYATHQIHVPRAPHQRFVDSTPHGARGDAMVELDWCVGQVVEELRLRGRLDNTLILFTGDNGPVLLDGYKDQAAERIGSHRPAGPYRGGKYSRFEGGTRVPWIVHWPARISRGVSDAIISQVDLYSTFAALVGAPSLPKDAAPDSRDLSAVILGNDPIGRDDVVEHSGTGEEPLLALRRGEWKYIEPVKDSLRSAVSPTAELPYPQLYNLENDPGERVNVAEQRPELVKELASLLDDIRGQRRHPVVEGPSRGE